MLKNNTNLTEVLIETKRLRLVPISFDLEGDIFLEFDSTITQYMYPRPARNLEETQEFIRASIEGLRSGNNLQMVILLAENSEFVGCIGLHEVQGSDPEIGIWIKKSSHGNGYGREACFGVIDWAKANLFSDHLKYPVDKRNVPSRRIAEDSGGKVQRTFRSVNQNGVELDQVEYWIPSSG